MKPTIRYSSRTRTLALASGLLVAAASPVPADDAVVFEEGFEEGAARWEPTDASAWKVSTDGDDDNKVFELTKKRSDYEPPHRSPYNIALVKDLELEDFVLTAKVKTTHEAYGHRDLCFFFGYKDPAHFYYVHLGQEADPHANQIFIVNDAPRKAISTKTTDGTPWKDDHWHTVKIVRNASDGTVEVYFDDMETPAMTAKDSTFGKGRFGVGSFDDTGMWDDIVVRAPADAKGDE